jgi:hypothetical protein
MVGKSIRREGSSLLTVFGGWFRGGIVPSYHPSTHHA